MNQKKQQVEKRKVLNQLRYQSISGSKSGLFQAYMSETDKHMDLKYLLWKKLRKAGYKVYTEVIFKSGIRMDILAFNNETGWISYEILCSETDDQFKEKIKSYPNDISIVKIRNQKDIDNIDI